MKKYGPQDSKLIPTKPVLVNLLLCTSPTVKNALLASLEVLCVGGNLRDLLMPDAVACSVLSTSETVLRAPKECPANRHNICAYSHLNDLPNILPAGGIRLPVAELPQRTGLLGVAVALLTPSEGKVGGLAKPTADEANMFLAAVPP